MEFKTKYYRNNQTLPLNMIIEANDNGWLDTLTYFVWLKKKNVIYNYTARSAAKIFNIHPSTLIKHVEKMKSLGLVFMSGGNLCTIGVNRLYVKYGKPLVKVKYTTTSKSNQQYYIKFFLLKHNLKTQDYVYSKKSKLIKIQGGAYTTKAEYYALLNQKKPLNLGRMQDRYTLSNKSLGELYGRSQCTGLRLQKKFRELNLIKTSSKYKLLETQVSELEFNIYYKNCGYIRINGNLYRRDTNTFYLVGSKKETKLEKWEIGMMALRSVKCLIDTQRIKQSYSGSYVNFNKTETSTIS